MDMTRLDKIKAKLLALLDHLRGLAGKLADLLAKFARKQ